MFNKNHQKHSAHKEVQKDSAKPKRKISHNYSRSHTKPFLKKEVFSKIEWPNVICERCGKEIKDLNVALSDKKTGNPIHFDCILEFIKSSEEIKENEEVIYIGNGNFAIVVFENPKIRKNFRIIKSIEWEERNKSYQWKDEIKELSTST